MDKSIIELFGEPISIYTEHEALEDGILMANPSKEFPECNLITTNLWDYIEKKCKETSFTEPIDLLDSIMKRAWFIYKRGKFHGDHDRNFFVINGNKDFKPVWFVKKQQTILNRFLNVLRKRYFSQLLSDM